MKNITKVLALTVLFTGLTVNAEVDLKDNNVAETAKTTCSQRVVQFAKDHKKKLIAGAAFAATFGYGYYKTANGPVWKKTLIAPLVTPIVLSRKILNFIAYFNLKNDPASNSRIWKNKFVGKVLINLCKPVDGFNEFLLAFLKS